MKELPHLKEYIDRLPDGLDSVPDTRAKASLYRATLGARRLDRDGPVELPGPLMRMLEHPYPVSTWIPEVHSAAFLMATRDLVCEDDADFLDLCYQRQRELFSGPLYAVLLKLTRPSLLLRTAAFRWSSLHRGSTLVVDRASATGASVHVAQPPYMWNRLMGLALIEGLRAVLELSGARELSLQLEDVTPQALHVSGTWQPPR